MHTEQANMVRNRMGKWLNTLSQVGLAGQEWSKHKHTHRWILCSDCSQREAGMFTMSLHSEDENVRVRGRELGL
jgi:hypothetical protein